MSWEIGAREEQAGGCWTRISKFSLIGFLAPFFSFFFLFLHIFIFYPLEKKFLPPSSLQQIPFVPLPQEKYKEEKERRVGLADGMGEARAGGKEGGENDS